MPEKASSFERVRLTKLQADKIEIELNIMRNELVYLKDVESYVCDLIIAFKTKLLTIPSKLSPMLEFETDKTNIEAILRNEMYEALNEIERFNAGNIASKYNKLERKGASIFEASNQDDGE